MPRRHLAPWLLALALTGCGPQAAPSVVFPAGMALTLGSTPSAAPVTAARHGAAVAEAPAPTPRPSVPAIVPSVAPPSGSGGASGAPAPAAAPVDPRVPHVLLADGRMVAVADADAIALPPGLTGLVSLIVPGRVPSTIELPADGVAALHPLATANAPDPTGQAVVAGVVSPAQPGVRVSYHAPGRSAYLAAVTDADGHFSLTVPLDGDEAGVLLAKDGQAAPRVALAAVTLHAGTTAEAPALALADPTGPAAAPALPAGWQWQGASLSAMPASSVSPWRVPVLAHDGDAALSAYEAPGFGLVASYAAASADERQGGLVCGAPGAPADWLAPIDPAGLPATLGAGAAVTWPAVPDAKLYTLRVTASGQPATLWEAASVSPRVTVPAGLALDQPGMVLELTAWDAPDVSIYSVASLRALRLPAGPQGLGGRLSWARRAIGPASK